MKLIGGLLQAYDKTNFYFIKNIAGLKLVTLIVFNDKTYLNNASINAFYRMVSQALNLRFNYEGSTIRFIIGSGWN